jgi:integrase
MAENEVQEVEPKASILSQARARKDEILAGLPEDDPLFAAAAAASSYIAQAQNPNTERAYSSDWKDFEAWCGSKGLKALPAVPTTVALYAGELASVRNLRPATVTRRLTAINNRHREHDLDLPASRVHLVVSRTIQGIYKEKGRKQVGKKPLTVELLQKMISSASGTLAASRDRALFLVGFAGGLRRSELAAIDVEDLHPHKAGITIEIPRSKTDQQGEGREVELVYGSQPEITPLHELTCPVRALEQWLKQANITEGKVLRKVSYAQTVGKSLDKDSIGRILKRGLLRAGFTRAQVKEYSGHSMRAGFATEAFNRGAREVEIMRQTGHRSRKTLEKYIRKEKLARQAAAAKLGL